MNELTIQLSPPNANNYLHTTGFPLAACLVKDYITEEITPGTHGSTYGGNPLTMTVGNAVLDIMLEEGFFNHVEKVINYLKEKLFPLAEEFPEIVSEVRGEGLLIGIELRVPLPDKIVRQSLNKVLIVTEILDNRVIRITPLILENMHVNAVCDIFHDLFF